MALRLLSDTKLRLLGESKLTKSTTGLKKFVSDIGEGFKDVPAQLQDILTTPSRFLGLPAPPLQSKLATQALPLLAEKATTPLPIPPLTSKNIKSVLGGKGITERTEGVSGDFSPLDIGIVGLMGVLGGKDVAARTQFNKALKEFTQPARIQRFNELATQVKSLGLSPEQELKTYKDILSTLEKGEDISLVGPVAKGEILRSKPAPLTLPSPTKVPGSPITPNVPQISAALLKPFSGKSVTPLSNLNYKNIALQKLSENPVVSGFDEQARNYITKDFDTALENFKKASLSEFKTDNVVSADVGKYALPGFNKFRSMDFHEAGSALSTAREKQLLDNPDTLDKPVLVMAGGAGSGKSSALRTFGKDLSNYALVHDTNLNSLNSAQRKIAEARATGRPVEVVYVFRDPVDATLNAEGSVLTRIAKRNRVVPLNQVLTTHFGSYDVFPALQKIFKNDPGVSFEGFLNIGKKGLPPQQVTLDNLGKILYTYSGREKEVSSIIQQGVQNALQTGRISQEDYSLLTGKSPETQTPVFRGQTYPKIQTENFQRLAPPELRLAPTSLFSGKAISAVKPIQKEDIQQSITKIQDLAKNLGVKIRNVKIENVVKEIDPNDEVGKMILNRAGFSNKEVRNAIAKGDKFIIAGEHQIISEAGGQKWSSITLYPGYTPDDVYHEFAHAIERQGGLPGWKGTEEEHARYLTEQFVKGNEARIAELTKEGNKVGILQEMNVGPAEIENSVKQLMQSTLDNRKLAVKTVKDLVGYDINDNRSIENGGTGPTEIIEALLANPEFQKLDIFKKIELASQAERRYYEGRYKDIDTIKQNEKQLGAEVVGVDTIRGCENLCISCYANKLSGQTRINHVQVVTAEVKGIIPKDGVLRVGVVGDPAIDWAHTAQQMEKVIQRSPGANHDKSTVFVTKLQNILGLNPKVIRNMQISVDPMNPKQMQITLDNIQKLLTIDSTLNMVLRIRSYASRNPALQASLQKAVDFVRKFNLPILETKMRFTATVAKMMDIDQSKYHQAGSVIKANSGFLKDKVERYLECDPLLKGCETCGNCARVAKHEIQYSIKKVKASKVNIVDKMPTEVSAEEEDTSKLLFTPTEPQYKIKRVPKEEKPVINLDRMNISNEAKDKIVNLSEDIKSELESVKGKPLTHDEVLEAAMSSDILSRVISRQQSKEFEVALARTRQHLAAMSEEKGISKEFIETLKIVKAAGTNLGRGLGSLKIEAEPNIANLKTKIVNRLTELGIDLDAIIKDSAGIDFTNQEEVTNFYRKFVKPHAWDIINEYRYINLLSSPRTHMVNAFSNLLQVAGLAPTTKLMSGLTDALILNFKPGYERQHYLKEVPAYLKGALNSIGDAGSKALDALKGKTFVERPDVTHIPTGAKFLKPFRYIPQALEASDVFFRTIAYQGELEAQLAKGIERSKAEQIAKNKASYWVFRAALDPSNKTGQGHLLSAIDNLTTHIYSLRKMPIIGRGVSWFLPFVQTPMNIGKQMIEYSPAGIFTLSGAKDKGEQLSKMLIGSIVAALAAYYVSTEDSTWAIPTGKKERELFFAAGKQPYSVKIGNVWVSYSKIGPLALPIAMAAASKYYLFENPKAASDNALQKMAKVIGGLGEFFADQSYVESIGDLMAVVKNAPGATAKFLAGIPSQLIPVSALQRWINNFIIDPVYRKSEKGLSVEAIIDNAKKSLIGMTKGLEPYTFRGKESKRNFPLINAFSPIAISKAKKGPEQELKFHQQKQRIEERSKAMKEGFNKFKSRTPVSKPAKLRLLSSE